MLAKLSGKEDAAVAKNIAMQIASMSPAYITRDEIPADVVEHERGVQMNIMKEDPKMAGKSEDMLAKIIEGKISKHFKDQCPDGSGILPESGSEGFRFPEAERCFRGFLSSAMRSVKESKRKRKTS